MITVSAPGKLMLFGEHAVVHGKPCIVTSVDQRLSIRAEKSDEETLILNAPDVEVLDYKKPLKDLGTGDIPKGAKFVEFATLNFIKKYKISGGIKIATLSQFKSTFGFGSSSASAVCTVKALSELFNLNLSERELFDLSYQTVLDVQGLGSGFDVAAAIYGGTTYFITGGKLIRPLNINSLPLIVGYTGIKADTPTLVRMVNKRMEENPTFINSIFENIENITLQAKNVMVDSTLAKVGHLMNLNQGQLEKLGVSSPELDSLIAAARTAGAYGAKLSGAGGGDCMIALSPEEKRSAVEQAIEKAGGQILKVNVNAEGVRIEK